MVHMWRSLQSPALKEEVAPRTEQKAGTHFCPETQFTACVAILEPFCHTYIPQDTHQFIYSLVTLLRLWWKYPDKRIFSTQRRKGFLACSSGLQSSITGKLSHRHLKQLAGPSTPQTGAGRHERMPTQWPACNRAQLRCPTLTQFKTLCLGNSTTHSVLGLLHQLT